MPETLDAGRFSGGPECVRSLRELQIQVSQRLGARLVALSRRGIQASLAVLEEAAPGSALETALLGPEWNNLESSPDPADVRPLLSQHPGLTLMAENGTVKIVTLDECDNGCQPAPDGSLLPVALGNAARAGFSGVLWDRTRMEEAALSLLDAEDPVKALESFRYLFRAALASGQDPLPLLVTAFRRGKLILSREAASLIKEHMARDVGRALEDLLSERPARMREGLHAALAHPDARWSDILQVVILPVLTSLLQSSDNVYLVLDALPHLTRQRWDDSTLMEPFLERLLQEVAEMDAPNRFKIGTFMVQLQPSYPKIEPFLLHRQQTTGDPHLQAFYGSVLSRIPIAPATRQACLDVLIEIFLAAGQDVGLLERLRSTFLRLGPCALSQLSQPHVIRPLKPAQRAWLITLWGAALADDPEAYDEDLFVRFATSELSARNRAALMELVRSGMLLRPALLRGLKEDGVALLSVTPYLLEEAAHLEDPDDLPVFRFLSRLEEGPLEVLYEKVREEAALDSKGAPYRLRVFARFAHWAAKDGTLSPDQMARLIEITDEVLGMAFIKKPTLPILFEALGALGSAPGLPEDLVGQVLDAILAAMEPYPASRLAAAATLYPSATEGIRLNIEERLLDLLQSERTPRPVLRAALETVEQFLERTEPPLLADRLAVLLARTVLRKNREASLESVLSEALQEDGDGNGVRMPETWGKEDRDHALRILGKIASHPAVAEDLQRQVTARLISFLEDWLDIQQKGRDLYLHRDTPLWDILSSMLELEPSEYLLDQADRIALRLLEIHRKAAANLALDRREDMQKFITRYLRLGRSSTLTVRGVVLDVPSSLLHTLMDLAMPESVTAYLLRELAGTRSLPSKMQQRLEAMLASQAR